MNMLLSISLSGQNNSGVATQAVMDRIIWRAENKPLEFRLFCAFQGPKPGNPLTSHFRKRIGNVMGGRESHLSSRWKNGGENQKLEAVSLSGERRSEWAFFRFRASFPNKKETFRDKFRLLFTNNPSFGLMNVERKRNPEQHERKLEFLTAHSFTFCSP